MSNHLSISRQKFTDLDGGESFLSINITDSYDAYSFEPLDKKGKEIDLPEDDRELVRLILNHGGEQIDLLMDTNTMSSVCIGGTSYEPQALKAMIDEIMEEEDGE